MSDLESAETVRIRKAEQAWACQQATKKAKVATKVHDEAEHLTPAKKPSVDRDMSLLSFLKEAISKLTSQEQKTMNNLQITYSELMAGMGTGTIAMETGLCF